MVWCLHMIYCFLHTGDICYFVATLFLSTLFYMYLILIYTYIYISFFMWEDNITFDSLPALSLSLSLYLSFCVCVCVCVCECIFRESERVTRSSV